MDKQKHEYRQIRITDLLLNPSNPRFNPVQHQKETILSMIEDQQGKLVALAEHILENGLNPTDIILVCPNQNQWLVLEGNRRVTALKLVNEPDLVPTQFGKLKRDFQKLNAILDNSILENIPCVVIEDRATANEWIRLKHTGENDGAGTVRWDGQQTSRFSYQVSGATDSRIIFFDYLKELDAIPLSYKERFSYIKKTNFDRLMGDPDVRALIGVESAGGKFSLINGVNAYLLEILYDLAFTDLSVGQIYRKEDRKGYLTDIIQRVATKQSGQHNEHYPSLDTAEKVQRGETKGVLTDYLHDKQVAPTSHTGQPSTNGASAKQPTVTPKQDVGKSYPINRKTIVPSQHKLTVTHGRIAKIFNELKSLDIETYPNAGAVLFRVFIELSADCYISKNSIKNVDINSSLSKKIEAVADDIESKKLLTKYELRAARQMATSNTQNSSVKTFHSYVHNKDVTPSSTDLKSAWDDLWTFIQGMWR